MIFEFDPCVRLLLVTGSNARVQMRYASNPYTWSMPEIGPRPPFYANPRYGANYPIL
ncbi:hypothetical protein [Cohnella sp.]|uniref:hypothetical protein n=1 Tax=Cohnella sp. TaxID=1883426 RepID=UPI00356B0782